MENPTQLHLASLQVSDLDRSGRFYREILNFKPVEQSPPDALLFGQNGGATFVIRNAVIEHPISDPPGLGVAIWFAFEDLQRFRAENLDKIKIVRDIHETPFGKVLVIADPDGYAITLHENTGQ